MGFKTEADVVVLGGLPVTILYSVETPDTSVGESGWQITDWQVTHVAGRRQKADWVMKKLTRTRESRNEVEDVLYADLMDR